MTLEQLVAISIPKNGSVSGLLMRPKAATGLFILGHGSGSNMRSDLVAQLAGALAKRNIATLRFNYPYSDHADYRPQSGMPVDDDDVLIATLQACLTFARKLEPNLPIYIGGHSMSALGSVLINATGGLDVTAVISLGYPAKGIAERRPAPGPDARPVLFIQGSEDDLGSVDEIERIAAKYDNKAQLHFVKGGSHGFHIDGREFGEVAEELARVIERYFKNIHFSR